MFAAPAAGEFIAGSTGLAAGDHRGSYGALRSLERTGLLTIDPAGDGARVIRVHPVVQAVVRTAMPGEVRDQAAQAAAGALLQAWPEDDDEQPLLAGALRSCVASLEQAAGDALWAGGSHQVLFRAGLSLDTAPLSGPAVAHWQLVASASERTLGPGHPDTLLATGQLASATLAAGLGAEAVALYQQALDTRIKVLGPDHPGTLTARADLGGALLAAGQPFEAIVALEAVLAEAPSAEPADLSVLDIQDTLAAAYQAAGRNPDAIRLAARTLAEREKQQGPDHPDTMSTRGGLARACLAACRVKDAIRHCRQAHDSARRVLGPEDPGTFSTLSALADAYHSARRLKDAIPLYEQVLRDRERIQGPDHPDTLGARGQLASAYHRPAGWPARWSCTSAAGRTAAGCSAPATRTRWPPRPIWRTPTTRWAARPRRPGYSGMRWPTASGCCRRPADRRDPQLPGRRLARVRLYCPEGRSPGPPGIAGEYGWPRTGVKEKKSRNGPQPSSSRGPGCPPPGRPGPSR